MIGSSFILQIIRLVFNIYISNKIDKESLGVFGLIMATYMFGITLASSGINIACTRIVSEEMAFGNDFGVRKSSRKCIIISLILGTLASFIFCINSNFISRVCFHDRVSHRLVYLIAIALPIISISSAINRIFCSSKKSI